MTPVSKFACALVLAGGLTTPAFAQTNTTPGSTGDQSNASGQSALSNDQSSDQNPIYNGNSNGQAAMHIGSALRAELTKAGYSDINIMPTSFMVRAKDSQGNPVMMVISPNSVTAIEQESADANATHNATGATPGATNP